MTGGSPGPTPVPRLLKKGSLLRPDVEIQPHADRDGGSARIRCPLCGWQPAPSSLWCCTGHDPAEPEFVGCGMLWNTFATRGLCPGCEHRWRWTKCSACGAWSPHDDWYDTDAER